MASIATFVHRFVGVRELADVPPAVWTRTEVPRLRPVANEDVYFWVKKIDNGGVIRAIDPAARKARSRSMATGFAAAILVIAGLVPTAYNITAGFTLEHLRAEQAVLKEEKAKLDSAEAQLVSMDRLSRLAQSLKMTEPQPQQVQTLAGNASSAEARVSMPGSSDGLALR